MSKRPTSVIDEFMALPDAEKERIFAEIEAETPEESLVRSRPLNARERKVWRRFKAKGRPRVGQGAKTISVTVERGLLRQADAYAHRHGLSRAAMFARGLRAVMSSAA